MNNLYKLEPGMITLFVTDMCNMRCKYCFEENKPIKGKMMTFDIAKKAIDLLLKNNKNYKGIDLFGGEPTLNSKLLKEIIEYCKTNEKTKEIHFKISSNLYQLNDEIVEILKEYQNVLGKGNFGITVSLDGTKELNDKNRVDINGNGTFDKIINNIKLLKKEIPQVFIQIHCVLADNNLKHTKEILEFLLNSKCTGLVDNVSIAPITSDTTEIIPKYEDIKEIYKTYWELIDSGKNDNNFINGLFGNYILRVGDAPKKISCCSAGKEQFAVAPDGEILVCHRYIEHKDESCSLGNIKDMRNCIYIDKNSEYYKKYIAQEWTKDVKNFCGIDCNKCVVNHLCHMCVGGNELANKDISINSEQKCERALRLAEVQTNIKLERVQKENNEILRKIQESLNLMIQGQIRMAELLLGGSIDDNKENSSSDVD